MKYCACASVFVPDLCSPLNCLERGWSTCDRGLSRAPSCADDKSKCYPSILPPESGCTRDEQVERFWVHVLILISPPTLMCLSGTAYPALTAQGRRRKTRSTVWPGYCWINAAIRALKCQVEKKSLLPLVKGFERQISQRYSHLTQPNQLAD